MAEIFEHTSGFYAAERVGRDDALAIDLAIEELFTNLVKYQPADCGDVEIRLVRDGDAVDVTLAGRESPAFDPTAAPEVDVDLPAERRRPGGLGLHLTRRMVEDFSYNSDGTVGHTRFRRRLASPG